MGLVNTSSNFGHGNSVSGVFHFEGVDYWYRGTPQDESYIGTELVAVGQTAVKTILIPKMALRR